MIYDMDCILYTSTIVNCWWNKIKNLGRMEDEGQCQCQGVKEMMNDVLYDEYQ